MPSKILLITEGKKSEPKLFNKIINLFEIEEDISIYQYQSSIYSLYDYIKNNYDLDDISNLDIVNLLKSRVRKLNDKNSEKYLEMLNQKFTDIILIFDFEPHDPKFNDEVLLQLSQHFQDETEHGLLLINYPMHESYKHYKYSQSEKDSSFLDLKVEKCCWGNYKYISAQYSNINRTDILNNDIVRRIILAHSEKIENITGIKEDSNNNLLALLRKQIEFKEMGFLYVVNTSLTFFKRNFSSVIFE
ncbi:hypothetical protein [Actinobacillus equuli]|uniref:hypothetical protein n=1 Tax=Actinobacillus equuli TaxID=718 RepID=UPI002441F28B|nr:hypothetical protein [Actinobacillus equuli]WGE85479.1 hypothetical protein NYR87_10275 [Actinobacillus equuli subsp. haemolyticus]